jgi:hypothetical protein
MLNTKLNQVALMPKCPNLCTVNGSLFFTTCTRTTSWRNLITPMTPGPTTTSPVNLDDPERLEKLANLADLDLLANPESLDTQAKLE